MPQLAEVYDAIASAQNPRHALLEHSFRGLDDHVIKEIRGKEGLDFYRGKVRDLIFRQSEIEIIHSDRLTAFDRFIDLVPYKGVILTHISSHWLELAKEVTPTHLLHQKGERTLIVKKTDPVRVEVVVRGYVAGSLGRAYAKGERECSGVKIADGLELNQKLPEPIITPTTKAPVGDHDEPISHAGVIERGLCTEREWKRICDLALQLFDLGTRVHAEHGWILVDTKYEFGRDANGEIILIDEIHTPDSSRFWVSASYGRGEAPVMLDKEIVRRWLLSQGFQGQGEPPQIPVGKILELAGVYLQVAEALTGKPIVVDG